MIIASPLLEPRPFSLSTGRKSISYIFGPPIITELLYLTFNPFAAVRRCLCHRRASRLDSRSWRHRRNDLLSSGSRSGLHRLLDDSFDLAAIDAELAGDGSLAGTGFMPGSYRLLQRWHFRERERSALLRVR
jgi:hypothetical protein